MAATPNYYQALEISSRATHQEIKDAYRRLAKRFHPDICDKEVNKERIVEINQAYEILGDRTSDNNMISAAMLPIIEEFVLPKGSQSNPAAPQKRI